MIYLWGEKIIKIRSKIQLPKAALRRDAVTPSCSVRGQPEGKPVRLSAVAAGEHVAIWKRFGNSADGKVILSEIGLPTERLPFCVAAQYFIVTSQILNILKLSILLT